VTTDQSTATRPLPTTSLRKTALIAGLLYLLTFVSIPTLALYGSVHDPNYVIGPGSNSPVLVGGVLEVIVALAGIGTAVVEHHCGSGDEGAVSTLCASPGE
jgi:hypothetical protein